MYNILFYETSRGEKPIQDFLTHLRQKSSTDKSARILLYKIIAYLDLLEEKGTFIGQPVTKHLDGEIWELRPLDNRILYAYYNDNTFLLLHHFKKKTQKTPKKELKKAKNNLKDYLERNGIS